MQGSARKDVVFGAAGVYPVTVPGPKWKSWVERVADQESFYASLGQSFLEARHDPFVPLERQAIVGGGFGRPLGVRLHREQQLLAFARGLATHFIDQR